MALYEDFPAALSNELDEPEAMRERSGKDRRLAKTLEDVEAGRPAPEVHWGGEKLEDYQAPSAGDLARLADQDRVAARASDRFADFPEALVEEPAEEAPARVLGREEPWSPFFGESARKGLAGLVTAIPSLTGAVASKVLPGALGKWEAEKAQEFKHYIEDKFGVKDMPVPKTASGKPSKVAEYVGKGVEFAVMGAIPSGFVVKAAERPLLAAMVEAAATGASAMGAVEGKAWGRKVARSFGADPERGAVLGEMFGSLMGPTTLATMGRLYEKTYGMAKARANAAGLGGEQGEEAARQAAGLAVQKEVMQAIKGMPTAEKNIAEAAEVAAKLPGFKPTIAYASDAPALRASLVGAMERDPALLAKGAEQKRVMETVIEEGRQAMFPPGGVSAETVAGRRLGVQQEQLANRVQSIDQQLREAAGKVGRTEQAQIGATLRELRDKRETALKEIATAKYSDAYALAKAEGVRPDMATVGTDMGQFLGAASSKWQEKPGVIGEVLRAYGPKAGTKKFIGQAEQARPVSVEEFHSLYKRTNRELGEAYLAKDMDRYMALKELKGSLTRQMGELEAGGGKFSAAFADANQFYGREIIERFQKGLGGKMENTGKFGEITQDEEIVRKLIKNPTGMKEFFGLYGESREALGTLTRGLTDDFARTVVKNGRINPVAAENYLRQNKEMLDALPGLREKLASNTAMTETLLARRGEIVAERKALDRGELAKFVKSDDPGAVVAKALQHPADLQTLVNTVKNNPQASASLARTVAERIGEHPDPVGFLLEHEKTLKPLMESLGKGHYDNLKTLAQAKEITGRVKIPGYTLEQREKGLVEEVTGTSLRGIIAAISPRTFATSVQDRVVNLGSRFALKLNEREMVKMREAVMFNPEIAKVLADVVKTGVTETKFNSLLNHLYAQGVRVSPVLGQAGSTEGRKVVPEAELEDFAVKYRREQQGKTVAPKPTWFDAFKPAPVQGQGTRDVKGVIR